MPTALTERLLWLTVTVYSVICIDATGKEPGTDAASELGEVQTEPIKNHTVNFSCILYEKFGIIWSLHIAQDRVPLHIVE